MKVFVNNQYDKVERCILVYPSYLQKADDRITHEIDLNIASSQYNSLINKLIEAGTKPCFFDMNGGPSQLFTRDIGFVIDDLLFISKMKSQARANEVDGLKEFALKNNIKHYIMQNNAEGGDILVHNNKVFIGQGDRTNKDAVVEINNVLKSNNINDELIRVFYDTARIHLDCVFNILDKHTCIISKAIYNVDEVVKHFSNVIEITLQELDQLAPNIVHIGNKQILCSSEHFSEVLKNYGYQTIYIQFDEIIKDKGSLGCCVLPIVRSTENI